MDQAEQVALFFRRRWPNGFSCPSCGYGAYYTISTRHLPLYECRLCGHQTSVTAGTVMAKTRTPLAKWAAAIELLASTNGVNAKRLAALIDVKHKTAWLMLRKFRQAIGEVEDAFKLQGTVHTGHLFLAPKYISSSLPHRLNSDRMHRSPLRDCILEARSWMNRLFNGVGTKYLQSYLDEFCFRWNAGASGTSLRYSWYGLCFKDAQTYFSVQAA
ncbi:IS1595 family transposase [Paenibacillus sp.]|uniref:IS1595 family transposase n=1 Tax=Paenibacillus sp. TaxID=58172 RepID=UPI002810F7EF|nr:IS1595 family transposase [Paenibacillus sp.]